MSDEQRAVKTLSLDVTTYPKLERLGEDASRVVGMRLWPGNVVDLLVWGATAEQVVHLLGSRAAQGAVSLQDGSYEGRGLGQ